MKPKKQQTGGIRKGLQGYNSLSSLLRAAFCTITLALSAFSCASDEQSVEPVQEKEVLLQFMMTRSGVTEDRIGDMRMIVFDKSGNCHVNTTTLKDDVEWWFEELVPTGLLDVYFIANELPAWSLASISSPAELKSKVLSYTVHPVVDNNNPIPMVGIIQDLDAVYGTTAVIDGEDGKILERLYAKVTLGLYCDFGDIEDTEIVIDKVLINSMPGASYLSPATYTASTFFSSTGSEIIIPGAAHGYAPDTDGFKAEGIVFYIPEYLISDKTKYTYLSIHASEKGNASVTREYTVAIGNGMENLTIDGMKGSSTTVADLTVSRNTHYMIEAYIKGFHQSHSLTVNAKVVGWEGVNIDTGYPTYLLTVSRDNFNLAAGSQGAVYINTDHPDGWKATIGNGSGQTSFVGYTAGTANMPPGYLTFQVNGAITTADTVKVTAGNITKKILIEN